MKNIITLSLFIASLTLQAQEYTGAVASSFDKNANVIRFTTSKTIPDFFRFKETAIISPTQFFAWLKTTYKIDGNLTFKEIKRETDQYGYTHIRYNQYLNNMPILDGLITLHIKNDQVISFNANITSTVQLGQENIGIAEKAALSYALSHVNADVYKWQVPAEEQSLDKSANSARSTYYPSAKTYLVKTASGTFSIAYRFDIYAHQPLKREEVYVDASNGSILFSNSLLNMVDKQGTAVTKFSGTQIITTDSINGKYRLRESGRGNGIETYDMKKGLVIANAIDFTDSNNIWDTTNVEKDEIATDVHWGAEMTYDYFKSKFNRNSIDGNGYALKSYVHYNVDFANAYWDGERMIFGDGDATHQPIVALDIIGHEISHGLTSFTSKLNLTNESGALNEGFSDIFGACIEHFAKASTANWTMGEDVGTPARDLSNPKSKNQPNTYLGTNWIATSSTPNQNNDFGGVHTNSTVLGYWFYLLVNGGSGTNDIASSYNVTGIGIAKAEQIAFRMQTVYLTSNSTFADARYYAIQSAIDIFGSCTPEVESTTNAMYAIGVGPAYVTGVTASFTTDFTNYCKVPAAVKFQNNSVNAQSFLWTFGDGKTSTEMSPTHIYDSLAVFTVTLYADAGSCSKDTMEKINYISIQASNPCIELMPSNNNSIVTGCSGILYDMGGIKNYPDLTYSTTSIFAPGASSITLTFEEFGYENTKDFLRIYSGNTTGNPIIGSYTGTSLPNGGTITTTTGAVTIEHTSDQTINGVGFRMRWQCNVATEKPLADFNVSDSSSCSGIIHFYDATTKGVSDWKWSFGDGSTSNVQNPIHTFAANGSYTVKLVVSNAVEKDSIEKVSVITVLLPELTSAIGGSRCDSGTVSLNTSGNGLLNWYTHANDTVPIFVGSNFNTPGIDSTKTYYVGSQFQKASVHVTPASNTAVGAGGYYNQAKVNYMLFNSYKPQKLVSVKVYAASAGDRTIILRSIEGTVLASKTVNIPTGESRITLNFDLPVATGLRLEGPFNPNLYRNGSGAVYPYTIPGAISITGNSSTAPGYYYYFYDWEIQNNACESPRQTVVAAINKKPDAQFTYQTNGFDFAFTNTSKGMVSSYAWDFGDGSSSTDQNPTHTFASNGQYPVKLVVSNSCNSDTITQTVNINVGVAERSLASAIEIHPNPAQESFTLVIGDQWKNQVHIEILDVLGKRINMQSLNSAKTIINISNYERGVYMLRIIGDKEIITRKLVVN